MDYLSIRNWPTSLKPEEMAQPCTGWHESLLRSYHIVEKVKWLIEKKTDPDVILELVYLMEGK